MIGDDHYNKRLRDRLPSYMRLPRPVAFYATFDDHEIKEAIGYLWKHNLERANFKTDLLRRLQDPDVSIIILEKLIIQNNQNTSYWNGLKETALDHLKLYPAKVGDVIHHAAQANNWLNFHYLSYETQDGFYEIPVLTMEDRNYCAPILPEPQRNKKDAKTQGTWNFLQAYIAHTLVDVTTAPQPAFDIAGQRIGVKTKPIFVHSNSQPVALIEAFRSSRKWPALGIDFSRTGPDHSPVFECVLTLTNPENGEKFTATATDKAKKFAKGAAATLLFQHVSKVFREAFRTSAEGPSDSSPPPFPEPHT